MGKLIVLEGLDGSGKSTQLELLLSGLQQRGIDCRSYSFPDYESDASAPLRMYLSGAFGDKPGDVNAYAAATFFSIDRYANYKQHWEEYYKQGGNVIVGRYTTSNAIHQGSKLPKECWENYLAWLYDFEYNKMGLPKPDLVVFLDMPVEVSQRLLSGRYQGNEAKKDIHERDIEYLETCRRAATFAAFYSGWQTVHCAMSGQPRAIGEIADEIMQKVLKIIKK